MIPRRDEFVEPEGAGVVVGTRRKTEFAKEPSGTLGRERLRVERIPIRSESGGKRRCVTGQGRRR